jgi:hypothetical protein
MLDESHHSTKVKATSISDITSKNTKKEDLLDTYTLLEYTEARETFLGIAKIFSRIRSIQ